MDSSASQSISEGMTNHIRDFSREMGLLFEVETFIYLTDVLHLKPIGDQELTWAIGERVGRSNEIKAKKRISPELADLVAEFVHLHASGPQASPPGLPNGMGHMIQKNQPTHSLPMQSRFSYLYWWNIRKSQRPCRHSCGM